jgi:hypothetical protein
MGFEYQRRLKLRLLYITQFTTKLYGNDSSFLMMAQLPSKNEDPQWKYHGTVKTPLETHIETADLLTIMEY